MLQLSSFYYRASPCLAPLLSLLRAFLPLSDGICGSLTDSWQGLWQGL